MYNIIINIIIMVMIIIIIQLYTVIISLCTDGGGCLYIVIQWKTATSILQSGNWANKTIEAKVRNTQRTMIPVLSCENVPARRKRP